MDTFFALQVPFLNGKVPRPGEQGVRRENKRLHSVVMGWVEVDRGLGEVAFEGSWHIKHFDVVIFAAGDYPVFVLGQAAHGQTHNSRLVASDKLSSLLEPIRQKFKK